MADMTMPPVEVLRIEAIDLPHSLRHIALGRFN